MALTTSEPPQKNSISSSNSQLSRPSTPSEAVAKLELSEELATLKELLQASFATGFQVIQDQLQGYVMAETVHLADTINLNIQSLSLPDLQEIFLTHHLQPEAMSQDQMVLVCLSCFGLHLEPQQWQEVTAITQGGGASNDKEWWGCVEPELTHQKIENKSRVQKRDVCRLRQGLPRGRFSNRQQCVQTIMHQPELCRPPPSLLSRATAPVRDTVSRGTQQVRQAMTTERGYTAYGTLMFGISTFLNSLQHHSFIVALVIAVCLVWFLVYTGAATVVNQPFDEYFDLQQHLARQRQAEQERQRQQAEQEAAWQRQVQQMAQRRRELHAERERKLALATRVRRLLQEKIRVVLRQLPFIRKVQITISDRLRRGDVPLDQQVNLLGARVQVIGKGFGTIVGQTPETTTRAARDIVEFDPTPHKPGYRKALVLGTTRKKKYSRSVGKTFRLIGRLANQSS